MSWAAYTKSTLDLTDEGGIVTSRPYAQGRESLDGNVIFVRFVRDEVPWPGGTTYNTPAEARAALSSPVYTAPPTPEEIAQEVKAVADYKEDQLLRLAAHKLENLTTDLPVESRYLGKLREAAESVRDGGYNAGNAIIDSMVVLYKANITNTVNKILQTLDKIDTRMIAVHNLVNAGQRARSRDEDVQPFIDALRAL